MGECNKLLNLLGKHVTRASKMVQRVKVLPAKTGDLSSISGFIMVEGDNQLPKVVL